MGRRLRGHVAVAHDEAFDISLQRCQLGSVRDQRRRTTMQLRPRDLAGRLRVPRHFSILTSSHVAEGRSEYVGPTVARVCLVRDAC